MQLSIIIVNYNVRYFLEQCLYSVQAAVSGIQAEIIVVDNASTDGSVDFLQPHFPWVQWIVNTKNTGFGAANNQAVAVAKGAYILFLNPDTLVPETCLQDCLLFMQQHPEAGALGIKMLDGSGQYLPESKRGFPTLPTSFFKLSGLTARFPRSERFARYYLGHLSNHQNHPVEVLAGAFILVRQSVLAQTGAFDERFFMYGEDIDLSYRIGQAGWQNWYFAESSIIHFKGESTKKGSLNYVRMFYQAMYLFVQKHYTSRSARVYRWLIQGAIRVRAGVSVLASATRKITGGFFSGNKSFSTEKYLVAGSDECLEQVIEQLKKKGASVIETVSLSTTGSLQEMKVALNNWQDRQLIFCLDKYFSLQMAIEIMEQFPGRQYGFHFSNSISIISSSSKNSGGNWIAD